MYPYKWQLTAVGSCAEPYSCKGCERSPRKRRQGFEQTKCLFVLNVGASTKAVL